MKKRIAKKIATLKDKLDYSPTQVAESEKLVAALASAKKKAEEIKAKEEEEKAKTKTKAKTKKKK
jgi:hypothetical protein